MPVFRATDRGQNKTKGVETVPTRSNILRRDPENVDFCVCGGYIESDYEWLGEPEGDGLGYTRIYDTCEECGNWATEVVTG